MAAEQRDGEVRRSRDSAALRSAASTLRGRIPTHHAGPLGDYTQLATAKLLDALVHALDRGDDVHHEVRTSALEIAGHVNAHPPRTSSQGDVHN